MTSFHGTFVNVFIQNNFHLNISRMVTVTFPLLSCSSSNDKEDDDLAEFRKCIRVLASKVGSLSLHREELLDKYSRIEATNEQLRKELEEKMDQVKTYYNKHQLEKQVTHCPYFHDGSCFICCI